MLKVPHFETEREEADWWYDNRDLVEAELIGKLREGNIELGPGSHARRMAALRGITPEQWMAERKAGHEAETRPASVLRLPRSA